MKFQLDTIAILCVIHTATAFTPSWTHIFKGVGGNNSPPSPPSGTSHHSFFEDGDDSSPRNNLLAASFMGMLDKTEGVISLPDLEAEEEYLDTNSVQDSVEDSTEHMKDLRGGSTKSSSTNDVVAGAKSSMQTTVSYWSHAIESFKGKVKNTFSRNKKEAQEEEIDLAKVKIEDIQAPKSDILPDVVIKRAAQRSGLLGSTLRADRVNECARQLKKFYMQRGYVLHSVTGATLHTENRTATLNVQEPVLAKTPVAITFAKEVPIDPETGETTTRRKLREKIERRKGRPLRGDEWNKISNNLNTTLIEANGRTNARTLSKRLGLRPGKHFCWKGERWQRIAQSGIFSKIWQANPVRMGDGTVQLQVLAQEAAPRNLEYGISKSLYTGHWEGELDFRHDNILGGGESLGVIVRRGAKDAEPSVTLRFTDDKFGMNGGYDAEFFREYLAVDEDGLESKPMDMNDSLESEQDDIDVSEIPTPIVEEEDSLLCRQGFKFSLRGPIPSSIVRKNSASALIERTSTRKGIHETIGSGTLNMGPFVQYLPLGARASLSTSGTTGARISEKRYLPYSSGKCTIRQIFPLLNERAITTSKQVCVAIEHTLMGATCHLPRHEANAAGFAARVRGYSSSKNGPIDASVTGSTELRFPVTIPFRKDKIVQDASIVLFGDYMLANRKKEGSSFGYFSKENMFGRASIGFGLRKSLQGIPLKYDVSLNKDGKLGGFVSLGGDWDI
jgi:outer membrane protein assembly factor BamA